MLSRLLKASCILLTFTMIACGGTEQGETGDGMLDQAIPEGKTDSGYSDCALQQILVLVNDPTTTVASLKSMGIASTAAKNIIKYRDGADGIAQTADDNLFETVKELDDIYYVGKKTFQALAAAVEKRCQQTNTAIQVVFSPQVYSDCHLAKIAEKINAATSTIDIAMYSFSDSNIFKALEQAVKRGVSVRMVFEQANQERSSPQGTMSSKLEDIGINVRYINKIMHHKFAIIDGPRDSVDSASTGLLITGSANWSTSAGTRFDENTEFITGNSELLLRFQKEFNLLYEFSRDFVWNQSLSYSISPPVTDSMIVDDPAVDAVYTSSNFKTTVTSYGGTFSVIKGNNTIANKLVELIQNSNTSIHLASGHLRSNPVAQALLTKRAENPDMDIRIYLDNQEYISKSTHDDQQLELQQCLDAAGTDANKQLECYESGLYFSYAVQDAGIGLRFKYYCYRWDYTYAPQMHHKYFVFDGKIVASGSYNLSDNAEHNTIENMVIYDGSAFPEIVEAFESNFESMWATDDNRDLYQSLLNLIENTTDPIPLTFDAMALTWEEVTNLKKQIRTYCPAVDSEAYRKEPTKHTVCYR